MNIGFTSYCHSAPWIFGVAGEPWNHCVNSCFIFGLFSSGWLEPLLDRILQDKRIVPWPLIDQISETSFRYYQQRARVIGVFKFDMKFHWKTISNKALKKHGISRIEPLRYFP